jgi:hypothetical protein
MPTNISDDPNAWTNPIQGPADPDPADKTYVLTVAQAAGNRTAFLAKRLGLIGHGGLWRESTTEIGFKGLVLATPTHGVLSIAPGSIDVSSLVGGLANSTWYYVYVYDNAGSPTIECNTTVPDPLTGYRTKGGGSPDASRLYVGCFRTDASAHIVPFQMIGGRYVYQWSGLSGNTYWRSLNAGSAVVSTVVGLKDSGGAAFLVPPHARLVTLRARTFNGAGSAQGANILTNADTGNQGFDTEAAAGAIVHNVFEMTLGHAGSSSIEYLVTNALVQLSVWVMGFQE